METIGRKISLLLAGVLLLGTMACQPQKNGSTITPAATIVPSVTPTVASIINSKPTTATQTIKQTEIPNMPTPSAPQAPIYGVGMDHITPEWGVDMMKAAGIHWVRLPGVEWSKVEPVEGNYNWAILSGLEDELSSASSRGLQVILLVHSTPAWARKIAGDDPTCGPIAADKFSGFGDFMAELVSRYSVAPYHVKYWEIWNEEDVDSAHFRGDSGFGCWGDAEDEYFGGGYYAEMMKVIYPKIKAADPDSQVLVGGLLLDCDPRGGCAANGKSDRLGLFLEGILVNDGASSFDGVSFHAYDYYGGELGIYGNASWHNAWNTTGPLGIAKAQYIRSLFDKYGVSGKYLLNTETALLCGSSGREPICLTDEFSRTKAYYVTQTYTAAMAQGVYANLWYSTFGWRGSGLLDRALNPLPAYEALKFLRAELEDATFTRDVSLLPGVKGYSFDSGDRNIWVLWSLDGKSHTITLPLAPDAAWDALGNPLIPTKFMPIDLVPTYLEWYQ
jgi:hypothetical protein